jgi:hypothetical protein
MMRRTVDMRFEPYPFLAHLSKAGEAHDLKAAAIGQNGRLPVHELVQATKPLDPLGSRTQHQMIGIAKKDIRTRRPNVLRQHRLHSCSCAHRHEGRRTDFATWRRNHAGPGTSVSTRDEK